MGVLGDKMHENSPSMHEYCESIDVHAPPLYRISLCPFLYVIRSNGIIIGWLESVIVPDGCRMSDSAFTESGHTRTAALQRPHFDPGPGQSSRILFFTVSYRPRHIHRHQNGSSYQGPQCQDSVQPIHGLPFLDP